MSNKPYHPSQIRPFPNKPIDERKQDKVERDSSLQEHLDSNVSDKYRETLERMYGPKKEKKDSK